MFEFGPAYISAIVKFTEFWLHVDQAPEETKIFCSAIERIRKDRSIAQRERDRSSAILDGDLDLRNWIDGVLEDTEEALRSVGRLLENFRTEFENGEKIGFSHCLKWVLTKREEFLAKSILLTTCHQSLSSSILVMHTLETHEPQILATFPACNRECARPFTLTNIIPTQLSDAMSLTPRVRKLPDDERLRLSDAQIASTEIAPAGLYDELCSTDVKKSVSVTSKKFSGVLDTIEAQAADSYDGPQHFGRRRRRHAFFTQTDQDRTAQECGRGISARRAAFFHDLE